jgi:hypothetical protein
MVKTMGMRLGALGLTLRCTGMALAVSTPILDRLSLAVGCQHAAGIGPQPGHQIMLGAMG